MGRSHASVRRQRLEARRVAEIRLPERARTRIKTSEKYQRWITTGGPKPKLETPEEKELREYFDLVTRLAVEMHRERAAGITTGETSAALTADFDAHYRAYPPS